MQQSGEDWNDIALAVSTVRTARGGSAPDLDTLLVRYPAPPRPVAMARPATRAVSAPAGSPQRLDSFAASRAGGGNEPDEPPAEEAQTVAETGGFQVLFRVAGRVSVPAGAGAKAFRISTANVTPALTVRASPALDDNAYLEAAFKQNEDAPLLPGQIALYRDGFFVGRGRMALTPKEETVRIGFGVDEKVKVARATVRRNEGSTGIITTAKTDEREFKITVRNGHDTPIGVTIEDRVPVSEIADVHVDLLPMTTPPTQRDVKDRRGVLAWSFNANPGELREIKLGWRVRWPTDKNVVYEQRRP